MISIADGIKNLYKKVNSNEVTKDYKIAIGTVSLSNKDLVYGSFKLEQKLCSADTLTFGECNAAMVQFQCASSIGDVKGKELVLQQSISSDSTSGILDLGVYVIDSCEITENKKYRTITAYDNIYKFNANVSDWYEKLTFPISMINMFKSLCTYVGVKHNVSSLINGTLMIDKTISADDLQGITVLKCIAELNGGFFRANGKGIIEFVQLSANTAQEEVEVKLYSSLKKEDYATLVYDKLNIRMEDGDIGVISGSGDNAYIIEDNFLIYGKGSAILQPVSDKIFKVIKNISYVPFTSTQIGLPYIQVGDYIQYDTLTGSFSSFILTRTLTGTQILKDTIETKGTEKTCETFGVQKEIIKLKGKSNVLTRSIEETKQIISDLDTKLTDNYSTTTDMKSAIEQSASGIKQEVSKNYQSIARAKSDLKEAKSYADEVGNNVDSKAKGYANTAESNAKNDTIAKLKAYSTTEQMNTAISQSADSIKLEVNKETDIKLEEVVSNIDIGATNLLAGSIIYQEDTKLAITATKNAYYENHKEIYADLKENETYTVNCQADAAWGTENISAELMCTNEDIVNKVRLFTLYTNYSYSQANIDEYSANGYTGKWFCRPVGNLKVNNIARIRVYNTTTKTNNYILTKVIKIESDNRTVTTTSLGVCMTTSNTPLLISGYSYNQAGIDKYSAADYSGTWIVSSVEGIAINDIVSIRLRNSTTNEYNYIYAKVTKINSDTKKITATSIGVCIVSSVGGIVCKANDTVSLKCRASGGASELRYKYEGKIVSNGDVVTLQDWSDNDSYSYTPVTFSGGLDITVSIKDKGDNVVTSNTVRLFVNIADDCSGYQYPSNVTVVDTIKAWLVDNADSNNSIKIYPTPCTFKCIKSGRYYISLGVNKNGSTRLFWNFKLEKGNKATDWSPSPYDIDSKFNDYSSKEETKSAIEAASDNINLSVTKKISESNEGNLDEKEGYELISNATQKSYCVLDYIKGYTTQSATPTPDNPIDIQNMSASFDIASENKDKSETSKAHIELASELCAGESIIRADKNIVVGGINVKKGDWYVERCVNKLKFNYEANIILVKSVGTYNSFKITPAKLVKAKASTVQYSNKYRYLNDESDVEHFYVNTDGCIYVFDSAADVSAFKSKLAAKALEIEYQTTSKSYEALNDDSQSAMHSVVSYADYTKIYVNLTTKPYIKGTFKSALYGETVESKAEIDMQSKCIVLKVDNNGNIVSVAIGEDAKDGNVIKISGNMVVGGQIKSNNYKVNVAGMLLDLIAGNIYTPSLKVTQQNGVELTSVDTGTTTDSDGYVWNNSSKTTQKIIRFTKQGNRNTGDQHISIQTLLGNGIPLLYADGKPVGTDIGLGFAKMNYGTTPGTTTKYNQVMYVKMGFNTNDNFAIQALGYGGASVPELEFGVVNIGTLKQAYGGPIWVDNPLNFRKQKYPQLYGNGNYLHMSAVDNSHSGVVISNVTNDIACRPASDCGANLGIASKRWTNIYAATSAISTSDRNKKTNINVLDEELTKHFIRGLMPYSYKMIDGTSDRTHTGLIAQDIEELLNKLNIDTKDFAGFIKSPRTREIEEQVLDEKGKPVLDENGNEKTKVRVETIQGEYDYALRYEEFISPLIRFVQLQDKDISELKETIKQQQQSIDELTELVKKLLPDNIDNLSESEVSEE